MAVEEKSKGLFDLHVHGGGGFSFASTKPEEILKAYHAQKRYGTTYLLATLVCLPFKRMCMCLEAIKEAMQEEPGILGAYIEGPFINPKRSGGMRRDYIEGWDEGQFIRLIERYADIIKMMVVAPEMDRERKIISLLKSHGIKVAVGHSEATYEECMEYVEKGVFIFTHIYNAMGAFHHRSPGVVVAALLSESYCEIIPEPHHIHPAAMELAMRLKGEKLIFVSDGTPLSAGGPLSMQFGGELVFKRDGACYTSEGKLFGSAITLKEGLEFVSSSFNIPFERLAERNNRLLEEFL